MTVDVVGEKYRCNICGNEVTVTKAGGGTLVCCGEDMEKVQVQQFAIQDERDSGDIHVQTFIH